MFSTGLTDELSQNEPPLRAEARSFLLYIRFHRFFSKDRQNRGLTALIDINSYN